MGGCKLYHLLLHFLCNEETGIKLHKVSALMNLRLDNDQVLLPGWLNIYSITQSRKKNICFE